MDGATIYALATPVPSRAHPGAISVIRLSGPRAADVLVIRRAILRCRSRAAWSCARSTIR